MSDIRPLGIFTKPSNNKPLKKEEHIPTSQKTKDTSSKENSPQTINGVEPAYKIRTDGTSKNGEGTWKISVKKIGYKRSGKLRKSNENTA